VPVRFSDRREWGKSPARTHQVEKKRRKPGREIKKRTAGLEFDSTGRKRKGGTTAKRSSVSVQRKKPEIKKPSLCVRKLAN